MAGEHQLGARRAQVEHHDRAGREDAGVQVGHQPVGPGHHGCRLVALRRVGAQGVAQLAHDRGRAHRVTLHVADHEGHPVAGQLQHVVPVAAHAHPVGGGQVARGGDEAGGRRQCPRQQLLLQLGGEGPLRVAQPGPGQRLGEQSGDAHQQRPVVRREVPRVVEADREAAQRAAGHREREERPGLLAGGVEQRPPTLEHGEVGVPGRQEQRLAGAQHLGDRHVVVGAEDVEHRDRLVGVAGVPGQLEPVGLGQRHQHPGGAERRQHHGGDHVDDVGQRVGLGEGGAVGEHRAGLVRPAERALLLELGGSQGGDVGGEERDAVDVRHDADLEPAVGRDDVLGEVLGLAGARRAADHAVRSPGSRGAARPPRATGRGPRRPGRRRPRRCG